MLSAHERRLLAFYLANAASGLHHRDREAATLAEWIADRENRAAFGSGWKRRRKRRTDPEVGVSARTFRRLEEDLRDECSATRRTQSDRTARRLRCLANATGLSRTDRLILELLLRYRTQPIIESMVDDIFGITGRHLNPLNLKGPALPMFLGVSANTVHLRFRNEAPLVRSGLVSVDSDGDLDIANRLHRLATVPGDATIARRWGIASSTLKRWRRWWLEAFPLTRQWQAKRGELAAPPEEPALRWLLRIMRGRSLRSRVLRGLVWLMPWTGVCALGAGRASPAESVSVMHR